MPKTRMHRSFHTLGREADDEEARWRDKQSLWRVRLDIFVNSRGELHVEV